MSYYLVKEYRKVNVDDEFYQVKVYKCANVKAMMEKAEALAVKAEKDMRSGEIVDFEIEY